MNTKYFGKTEKNILAQAANGPYTLNGRREFNAAQKLKERGLVSFDDDGVVSLIQNELVPEEKPKAKGPRKTVYCYQRINGAKKIPITVKLIADLGSRLRVEYEGKEYVVNAAACSYKKPEGGPRETFRDKE